MRNMLQETLQMCEVFIQVKELERDSSNDSMDSDRSSQPDVSTPKPDVPGQKPDVSGEKPDVPVPKAEDKPSITIESLQKRADALTYQGKGKGLKGKKSSFKSSRND